jgi:hypothetical protein
MRALIEASTCVELRWEKVAVARDKWPWTSTAAAGKRRDEVTRIGFRILKVAPLKKPRSRAIAERAGRDSARRGSAIQDAKHPYGWDASPYISSTVMYSTFRFAALDY